MLWWDPPGFAASRHPTHTQSYSTRSPPPMALGVPSIHQVSASLGDFLPEPWQHGALGSASLLEHTPGGMTRPGFSVMVNLFEMAEKMYYNETTRSHKLGA